jgi:hypothetical protein
MGFVGSKADFFLFTLYTAIFSNFILIYVDDIIISGTNSIEIDKFIQQLGATNSIEIDESIQQLGAVFLVKDLGTLSYFLGVEALVDGHDMFLTQRKYVADLLQ